VVVTLPVSHANLGTPALISCDYPGRLRVSMQSAFTEFVRKG
jgi:hypothetical protein